MDPGTIHRIDADDHITFLDDAFRLQAEQAGVPSLPMDVLGRSVFLYMAGDDTRTWYHWLLDEVRQSREIRFPFRCDTPVFRRDLEMVMRPLERDGIEFECRPVLEVPRAFTPLLDPRIARNTQSVTMCSWCKRIQSVIGWLEIEEAANLLQAFTDPLPPRVQYGLCSDDEDRLRGILRGTTDAR